MVVNRDIMVMSPAIVITVYLADTVPVPPVCDIDLVKAFSDSNKRWIHNNSGRYRYNDKKKCDHISNKTCCRNSSKRRCCGRNKK